MKFIKINDVFINPEQITLIQPNQKDIIIRLNDGNTLAITYDQWDKLKEIIESL